MTNATHPRHGLSKSRISAFEQCPKRLWLSVHRRDLAEVDAGSEARFAAGHAVGEIACALHPDGVMVQAHAGLGAAVAETAKLIARGHPGPIFEATFEHEGVLVRVDVLERRGQGWAAAEVKSATSVKSYHYGDLATQVWVMRGAGLPLESAAIRHIDNSFVLTREGEFDGLFVDAELLDELDDLIGGRGDVVASARETLAGQEPVHEVGDHCSAPFDCEYTGYCHKDLPPGLEWPVTLLPHGGGKKWVGQGISDLLALTEGELNSKNARILAATRDGVPFHDRVGARAAMAGWGWPRAWLDFETINPAIPPWLGTRPYQQIPFQFSLHCLSNTGEIEQRSFLDLSGDDPSRRFAEALIGACGHSGPIFVYNAGFETARVRELAVRFPLLAEPLLALNERVVDLLPLARNHCYYPSQEGSWSIKVVLPALCPDLSYDQLQGVKDGGMAMSAFLEALSPQTTVNRKEAIKHELLEYCALDTLGLVHLWSVFSGVPLKA